MPKYDSTRDTMLHIKQVRVFLGRVIQDLGERAARHDASKLEDPEKTTFDQFSPRLAELDYGTPAYMKVLREMRPALVHHYEVNDHHPEHFDKGVAEMDLIQVLEMLADWKAASMRHFSGDLRISIERNAGRFGYGLEFKRLLVNTADRLGWLEP